jgi:hypothetical protein
VRYFHRCNSFQLCKVCMLQLLWSSLWGQQSKTQLGRVKYLFNLRKAMMKDRNFQRDR